MTVYDLPAINATLNSAATLLLVIGIIFIKRGQRKAHAATMVMALVCSALFLGCYLYYHYQVGSVKFTHQGPVRSLYFAILFSHLILAIVNLPMIIATVIPAVRERFDRHKRIAKWTYPVWLYVSVTGVIVYFMLYQWYPPQEVLDRRAQSAARP